jgi:DNA repair ATPase RecN
VLTATGRSAARASVEVLDDEDRVEEIARMGTGLEITDAAREHAREMLGKAG